ncbi:vacuolar protein sorting-associated protein 2, putative [Plasmodium ovale]|uniref:Vacuolar protein sorting-associated protein 2, putative n=1 Tax=Plasmodium ovale TaxID=36330 RepID=A0A1D3KXV7_PLAOA|nr:vacuolar protein sorting-associated protein 2, putative [Plasmodium ovale]
MGGYFSKDIEECLREEKRKLNRSIRELEREIYKLENDKNNIEKKIKMYVNKNDITLIRTLAKDFVHIKNTISKFNKIKSYLFSMKIKLQSVKSSEQLSKNLKNMNMVIKKVNNYLKLENINNCINEFQKENNKVNLKEDMLDDLFETLNYDIDIEEEEDIIVSKVLDSIGVNLNSKLGEIPYLKQSLKEEDINTFNETNIEERINNLKRG